MRYAYFNYYLLIGSVRKRILFIVFITHQGALVTVTADDYLHMCNLRQKKPEIAQSLKFQKERYIFYHLDLNTKVMFKNILFLLSVYSNNFYYMQTDNCLN